MKIIRDSNKHIVVSGPLAILFLMLLSFLVAWYTVSASENILSNAKNTISLKLNERMRESGVQLKQDGN
jgi:hypothetical protein